MEPLVSRLIAQAAPKGHNTLATSTSAPWACSSSRRLPQWNRDSRQDRCRRQFSSSVSVRIQEQIRSDTSGAHAKSHSQAASKLSQNIGQGEKNHFDRIEAESKEKQMRSPWMREGSERPPVRRLRSAGAMTKGKLLTTPSRMLKLILPLTTRDANDDRKDVEPLALLVHPQQPLSYLERLIQSELPMLDDGPKERLPKITFRAQDNTEEDIGSGKSAVEETGHEKYDIEEPEDTVVDGKVERTGKIKSGSSSSTKDAKPPGPDETDSSSPEDPTHPDFVRWSPSTEIGDFIRDAARGTEFAVDIEGAPPIYVGVPSFNDRTYYLRMRLRKTSRQILALADIKQECDDLAQRGAKMVAYSGFGALVSWWGLVYYLTFMTSLGWDVMEPVTYLVGMTGIMGGYMWFLYNNREVSYRSALKLTVSRRQSQLYAQKGFNLAQWEMLVEEGNRLRREIKIVADEYDVEWDESKDEGDAKVAEALRRERQKKEKVKEEGEKKDQSDKPDGGD